MMSSSAFAKKRAAGTAFLIAAFISSTALRSVPLAPPDAKTRPGLRASSIIHNAPAAMDYERFASLPMSFEEDLRQADGVKRFTSRGDRYTLSLTATESVVAVADSRKDNGHKTTAGGHRSSTSVLGMKFVGADRYARTAGIDELPGKINYLIGNDPAKWRTNIPTFARMKCEHVYTGIDVVYYGNQRQLEYDWIVAPGADFRAIKIAFSGVRQIHISRGDLVLETAQGTIRQACPVAYQETTEGRKPVEARFVIAGDRQVGFELGEFDPNKPLTIDPILSYSSFLGGASFDIGSDIAVDSSGSLYVTGITASPDFPVTPGSSDTVLSFLSSDVFITKFSPAGTEVIYSTYLGGSSDESVFSDPYNEREGEPSIALDGAGSAYVTGGTSSSDFPVTPGAFQRNADGGGDAFITKLSPSGNALVYSTYLGGDEPDIGADIAVDQTGFACVTGNTYSRNFPTANALQPVHSDDRCNGGDFVYRCSDAFVTRLDPQGSSLIYSTYLGGNRYDAASGIAVDALGSAYVSGLTGSSDFPTTPGCPQPRFNGGSLVYFQQLPNAGDAFVSRISSSGSFLIYSTYLGGAANDAAIAIAVDSSGNAYVTGSTTSADFPVTAGAFQPLNGGSGAYKSRDSSGNWSSIKNGLSADEISALAIDPREPSTIFAASTPISIPANGSASIFKSTDGGANWRRLPLENVRMINAVAVDPRDSNIVYAGALDGVYKSTDGGGHWLPAGNRLSFPFTSVNAIAIDPSRSDRVYIGTGLDAFGTFGGGIFISADGGQTWEPANINSTLRVVGIVFSLAIDPKKTKNLYAGTNLGVFRGLNRGKKWKSSDLNPRLSVRALAIDPVNPSTVYAAATMDRRSELPDAGGVYKSTDGGKGWVRLDAGIEGLSIASVAVDPQNPSTLYAGLRRSSSIFSIVRSFDSSLGGLLKSIDGGSHWTHTGLGDVSVNTLAIDPKTPANLYAAAYGDDDIFITKVNAEGTVLMYSTYLGGRSEDKGLAIAVDSSGRACVTGATSSLGFPALNAFQPEKNGGPSNRDAFVAMLNIGAGGLMYSSYLGGAAGDAGLGIAVDKSGAVFLTGATDSANLPLANPFQGSYRGEKDAFVVRISPP